MVAFKKQINPSSSDLWIDVSEDQKAADFDFAIGLNRKMLKIIGLWPYPSESKWQTMRSNFLTIAFATIIFTSITLPQTLALTKVWGNLTLIIDNLMINLPLTTSIFKIIIPTFKKEALANIFIEIEKDWYEKKNPQERDVMLKYAATARKLTMFGLISAILSIMFYFCPLIFGIVPRTVTNLTDKPGRILPIQSVYLYDISTPGSYYLTLLNQIFGCLCVVPAYMGLDVLFGMILLHSCGRLEILSDRIAAMNGVEREEFSSFLKIHVEEHNHLIGFIKKIENVFGMLLLTLFGSVTLTVCILEFQIVSMIRDFSGDSPILELYFYIQHLSCFTFLMFIYTWVGEKLVINSNAIPIAIYNCDWYNHDRQESTQMILFLVGSQNPLQVNAGNFLPVTLTTFASLLKTSAGYVSFLLAIKG